MHKISIVLIAALIAILASSPAYAEPRAVQLSDERDEEIKEEITEKHAEGWLTKLLREKEELKQKNGTSFAVLVNYDQQLILNSAKRQGQSLGSWYYNVEIQQTLWEGAWVVADLEGGAGKGIDKIIPSFSIFNGDAGELSLAYMPYLMLGQNFLDDRIYLAGGRIDLSDWFDINTAANSADTQFTSSALVNNNSIPFPQKGLGFVAGAWFLEWAYLQIGISNADAKSIAIKFRDALKDAFVMTELGFAPDFKGLKGNYRFMLRFNRERLVTTDGETSRYGDAGMAISFDQQLTKKLTVFFRYGITDERVRYVASAWSTGFQLDNPLPGRKYDVFSFGVAQSIMSLDYIRSTNPKSAGTETMFETYYSIALNELFTLTPDLQVLINPLADKKAPVAVVCSARLLFLF